MNIGAIVNMMHNGRVMSECEHTLNSAVNAGHFVIIQNPDGSQLRLKPGCKILSYEAVMETDDKVEQLDLNRRI